MANAKPNQRSWVVTVGVGAIAVLFLMFIFLPGTKDVQRLRETLQQKRDFIIQAESLRPVIESTKRTLEETQAHNDRWDQNAPAEGELSMTFGQINGLAKTAGTLTTRFDPLEPVALSSLRRVPIGLGVSGSLAEIFTLLAGLERMPQAIWVEDLALTAPRKAGETIQCEAKLVIFTNNSENSD